MSVNRIIVIGLSLGVMALIIELIRRRQLLEKYAIAWLVTGSLICFFAIFINALKSITNYLGIELPSNAVFFFGLLFLMVLSIHFSVAISRLSEKNKKLVQKIALLETELKELHS